MRAPELVELISDHILRDLRPPTTLPAPPAQLEPPSPPAPRQSVPLFLRSPPPRQGAPTVPLFLPGTPVVALTIPVPAPPSSSSSDSTSVRCTTPAPPPSSHASSAPATTCRIALCGCLAHSFCSPHSRNRSLCRRALRVRGAVFNLNYRDAIALLSSSSYPPALILQLLSSSSYVIL